MAKHGLDYIMSSKFEEWLDEHQSELEPLIRTNDMAEVLYMAWHAGYEEGMNEMGKFSRDLFRSLR